MAAPGPHRSRADRAFELGLHLAVFANLPEEDRSPAHWLIFADVALQPILALVAAYAALIGKLRIAIMALAAMAIVELLLRNIPLMGPTGLDESPYGLVLFVQIYLLPALCVIALWLAWQNRRLQLAGVLAMLPTLAGAEALPAAKRARTLRQ